MPISSASPGPSTTPKSRKSRKRTLSDVQETVSLLNKKVKVETSEPDRLKGKDRKKRRRRKQKKISVVSGMSGASSLPGDIGVKLEESGNDASTVPASNNLDDVDVDSPRLSAEEKGKGRASDSALTVDNANNGAQDLTAKNELLSQHQTLLSTLAQTVTCQICLELMHNPYALAPCGHLTCYFCLVQWFTVGQEGMPAAMRVRRKKTCPLCRAIVRERPVEVWGVKSMVGAIAKSSLIEINVPAVDPAPPPAKDSDPWAGIFNKQTDGGREMAVGGEMGIQDVEDGGIFRCLDCMHEIWDGVCSNCGREYAGRIEAGEDAQGFLVDGGDGAWWGPEWLGDDGSDEEDGEGDHEDDGIVQEEVAAAMERILGRYRREADEDSVDEGGDEGEGDDGYESSFIDDEDDAGRPRMPIRRPSIIDIDSDTDADVPTRTSHILHSPRGHFSLGSSDDEVPAPPAVRRERRDVVDLLSSSDAEDGENPHASGTATGRRGRLRVVPSDDKDDEAEVNGHFHTAMDESSDSDTQIANRRRLFPGIPATLAHFLDVYGDGMDGDEFYEDMDRHDGGDNDSDWEEYY